MYDANIIFFIKNNEVYKFNSAKIKFILFYVK